ncbi:MAG: M1 family aminopeptidase [Bacteroidia bacterium]
MYLLKNILIILAVFFYNNSGIYSQISKNVKKEVNISQLENKSRTGIFNPVTSNLINNYDIKYHRCEWQINPAINYIKGSVTTYFTPSAPNFNKIQFDLSHTLIVDSIKYHHLLLPFNLLPIDVLEVNLPATISPNSLDSISVYYQGAPVATGNGSFTCSTHNGTPIMWTLSEPFGARDWWPCKQSLNDKVDSLDIIVTVPKGNRVASNGVLIAETNLGANEVFHWKTKYPIAAYLIGIAVTNYVQYSNHVPLKNNDSLQVLNYVYPEHLSDASKQTKDIVGIIKLYDSLLIPYPFAKEKYGHAQFGWGGGMEHQTMSFMSGFSYGLMAHECAHQWFGDYITCGSWEDIWLNEGFATYFEGLTVEHYFPKDWLRWKETKINNITSLPDGSVRVDDTLSRERIFYGRLTYDKGAFLLNMLRWKLGDSAFFNSLKSYLSDVALAKGYAKTPDLIRHLELISGMSLQIFFNQWYYNQGYPSYHLTYSQSEREVEVIVNQTQSHPSVAFFEMPIAIKFIGFNEDTTIVFNHHFSGEHFKVNLNFQVIDLKFDPELRILSANNSVRKIATENPIVIFPNPTKKDISVSVFLINPEDLVFEIVDSRGRIVYSEIERASGKNLQKQITTSSFANGTYFFNVKGKSVDYTQRFIKK